MNIGDKIAFYRKRKNITQEKLAENMEVSRQTIFKWESNRATPQIDKLEKLIAILEISYDELLN